MLKAILLGVTALLAGCKPATVPVVKTAPIDPWVLTSLDPKETEPALLWNGLIGVRLLPPHSGPPKTNEQMLKIDEYEKSGEEKIIPLPNPFQIHAKSGSVDLVAASGTDFEEKLDMRTGLLSTSWNQDIAGSHATIKVETAIEPYRPILGQRWKISSDKDLQVTLSGQFGSKPKLDRKGRIFVDYPPSKLKAMLRQNWDSGEGHGQQETWTGVSKPGNPLVWEQTCSFGYSIFNRPTLATKNIDTTEPPDAGTFERIENNSRQTWAERWKTDIEIDGPVADQQAVHSFLFFLRSAIDPTVGMSISPMGLSNTLYKGHVFWDADTWVFPALAMIEPNEARAIVQYRLDHRNQASDYFNSSSLPNVDFGGQLYVLRFPWESSVSGKETGIGDTAKQIHISGDVALATSQATALGLFPMNERKQMLEGVGNFYRSYAHKSMGLTGFQVAKQPIELKGVMGPDEYHIGDNDLYTNMLAQWVQDNQDSYWPFTNDKKNPLAYKLPQDSKGFLTYDGDPVKNYQQADAVLSIYPLQNPEAEKQAKQMMERFADKVNPTGPAMSDSVQALIWARLGETDRAYKEWEKSWQDFTHTPLLLFSEQRNQKRTYFATGAAGCLQAILYGFLGFRIDSKKDPTATWSKELLGGSWLTAKPHLPQAWNRVTLKNFTVLGHRYTLNATHNGVQVTQGEP